MQPPASLSISSMYPLAAPSYMATVNTLSKATSALMKTGISFRTGHVIYSGPQQVKFATSLAMGASAPASVQPFSHKPESQIEPRATSQGKYW